MDNLEVAVWIGIFRHWPVNGQFVVIAKFDLSIAVCCVNEIHIRQFVVMGVTATFYSFDCVLPHLSVEPIVVRYRVNQELYTVSLIVDIYLTVVDIVCYTTVRNSGQCVFSHVAFRISDCVCRGVNIGHTLNSEGTRSNANSRIFGIAISIERCLDHALIQFTRIDRHAERIVSKIFAHEDIVIRESCFCFIKLTVVICVFEVVQTNRNLLAVYSCRSQRVNIAQRISVFIGFIYALIFQLPFTRGRSAGTISAFISKGHVIMQIRSTNSSASLCVQPLLYIVWQSDEIPRFRQTGNRFCNDIPVNICNATVWRAARISSDICRRNEYLRSICDAVVVFIIAPDSVDNNSVIFDSRFICQSWIFIPSCVDLTSRFWNFSRPADQFNVNEICVRNDSIFRRSCLCVGWLSQLFTVFIYRNCANRSILRPQWIFSRIQFANSSRCFCRIICKITTICFIGEAVACCYRNDLFIVFLAWNNIAISDFRDIY